MMVRAAGPQIALHIDRLILDGPVLRRGQERRLRDALTGELARLIAAGGLKQDLLAGGLLRSVPAGPLATDHGGDPEALGRGIARALYGGLGQEAPANGAER